MGDLGIGVTGEKAKGKENDARDRLITPWLKLVQPRMPYTSR